MIDLYLFFDISIDITMATDFGQKMTNLPTFVVLAFRNGIGYRYLNDLVAVADTQFLNKKTYYFVFSRKLYK